ncbi:hypothetical protein AGMMS50268_32600 [Spirochaetia bacterium]|nr:hypothetical protein AGMMS50268_32540 [Spirochaetia bacterium]GHV92757.1 hypothetical protein AGMMS50268_32600 [Spirochaetia bacterium]
MAEEQAAEEKTAPEKFLVFTVQGAYYTFPSRLISEVAALEKVFPLPLLPDYVRGIINRYSAPYALIDIGILILKTPAALSAGAVSRGSPPGPAKTVVLKETVDKLAFLIDDVVDIVDVLPSALIKVEQDGDAPGVLNGGAAALIESSFEWHDTHVFCLSVEEIINQVKKDFEA